MREIACILEPSANAPIIIICLSLLSTFAISRFLPYYGFNVTREIYAVKLFRVTISIVIPSKVAMQTIPSHPESDAVAQNDKRERPKIVLSAGEWRGVIILGVVAFIVA